MDFIVAKEFDDEIHTIENLLKRMHLIAARELIPIDLNSYIKLLKEEFCKKTYYKNRIAMSSDAIADGIKLGLKLKK